MQRSLLACVESRDRFRGDASFRTYLFTIARNELYRILRRRARDTVAAGLDFSVSSIVDLGISPSEAFAREQTGLAVQRALQRLPVEQQLILELRYWEQLEPRDIAQIMGVADATARTRLFRAREKLRTVLAELGVGADADLDEVTRRASPG